MKRNREPGKELLEMEIKKTDKGGDETKKEEAKEKNGDGWMKLKVER